MDMKFMEHRVADKRILRLIGKWLTAGVPEDGKWSETQAGTPQGLAASGKCVSALCIRPVGRGMAPEGGEQRYDRSPLG
jgi:hypothetical protein